MSMHDDSDKMMTETDTCAAALYLLALLIVLCLAVIPGLL
jgi:hypothetical protein